MSIPKLRRSNRDRKIAGVCGGIAEYFNMDPTVVRVLYVLGSIMSAAFPGTLAYVVMWIIIPKSDIYTDNAPGSTNRGTTH